MTRLTGFAKADTQFGPLAGRTNIEITDQGQDSVNITFRCGTTPVMLSCAGANYLNLVRALIEKASPHQQELLNERLAEVLGSVA